MHRRDFLKKAATAVGALCASCLGRPTQAVGLEPSQTIEPPTPTGEGVTLAAGNSTQIYMPTVMMNTPAPVGAKVVHVHAPSVTNWTGTPAGYWNYVNQPVVNQMVDRGLLELTSQSTVSQAWHTLIPNYQIGKKIAFKVNFNNTMGTNDCSEPPSSINAIPHPVISLISGLISSGISQNDILIYDGVDRRIPAYFYNPIFTLFQGIKFYDLCHNRVSYDLNAMVTFSPPEGGDFTQRIADQVATADYIINIPIMKNHANAGVSLGFKNHFGTIEHPSGLHSLSWSFSTIYSPLVDIYKSQYINNKTVLTIGDGIFGALGSQDAAPSVWTRTYGNYPKSLFFAKDPVAIDCVMSDFLRAENGTLYLQSADNYLQVASQAGLGVCEHANPWLPSPYRSINYQRINL